MDLQPYSLGQMCLMSMVNSVMSDGCLVCHGDLSGVLKEEKLSSLGSVKVTNFLPLMKWWNGFSTTIKHAVFLFC